MQELLARKTGLYPGIPRDHQRCVKYALFDIERTFGSVSSMLLPTPNQEEVVRFQQLHKNIYGIELSELNARIELTRLVQFYYLTGGHDAFSQRVHAGEVQT